MPGLVPIPKVVEGRTTGERATGSVRLRIQNTWTRKRNWRCVNYRSCVINRLVKLSAIYDGPVVLRDSLRDRRTIASLVAVEHADSGWRERAGLWVTLYNNGTWITVHEYLTRMNTYSNDVRVRGCMIKNKLYNNLELWAFNSRWTFLLIEHVGVSLPRVLTNNHALTGTQGGRHSRAQNS